LPGIKGLGLGRRRPGRRHRGAHPDGHQWVPAPWFPPHTSRGGWGAGCGGSGRRFGAPSGPFSAVSALRGWSGVPQKSVEIRWNGIGVVRGWSPPHAGQVCERISAQTPCGSTPNPKSGSEIALNARSRGFAPRAQISQLLLLTNRFFYLLLSISDVPLASSVTF
jgi:hypothetical protein